MGTADDTLQHLSANETDRLRYYMYVDILRPSPFRAAGLHPIWVFPFRGHRIESMNNTGWQNARRAVGLRQMRVHDLRHTFACRLRAAGVAAEDRAALLGHADHSMCGHYASDDVGRLVTLANLVLNRRETRTVLRVAFHATGRGIQKLPTSQDELLQGRSC